MSLTVCLRVSYVVLTLSFLALGAQIAGYLLGFRFPKDVATVLTVASYIWPIALYAAAVYRRKLKGQPPK